MATEFQGFPKLRNIEPKVIQGESPEDLEAKLRGFFEAGGEGVFLAAFQVGELAILILYAE